MTYRSPSVSAVSDRIPATNRLSRKNSQTSKYSGTSVPSATPGDTAASNNNGHLTPTHSNPPTHSIETASFTVRREMERHREEMEQIQQLRQVISHIFMDLRFFSSNAVRFIKQLEKSP